MHGVFGTRLVEVPMMLPSKMNRQKFGFHSMTAVCQLEYVAEDPK